jgi:hypothetical protein
MTLQLTRFDWEIHPRHDEIRLRFRDLDVGELRVWVRWIPADIRAALLAHLTGLHDGPVHFRIISFALANDIAVAGHWLDDVEIVMERSAPISPEQLGPKNHAQVVWIEDIVALLREVA